MGCWNETCMLSHTTIFRNDDVYAGLIAMRNHGCNTADIDGLFMPVAPLVLGRYDHYGRPECIESDKSVTDVYKAIQYESLDPRDRTIKTFNPAAGGVSPDDMLDRLFDAARNDELYMVSDNPVYGPERLRLFPVMISARFWDIAQKSVKDKDLYLHGDIKSHLQIMLRVFGPFADAIQNDMLDEKTVLIPHMKLQHFMECARIPWHVTCGSGSQAGFTPEMYAVASGIQQYRADLLGHNV